MGNRISSIGTITQTDIITLQNGLQNSKIKQEKYNKYTTFHYTNEVVQNSLGDYKQSQAIFTVFIIELYNLKSIDSERVLLKANGYFIKDAKQKYNNKYLLNVFLLYDIKHDIHLDKYELDINILHTTNVHLIANDQDEKTKKIYINNILIFTLHTKTNSKSETVIEIKDNTVSCSFTRKMNRKIYDESIGRSGLKPNVITFQLSQHNKTYTLQNGWFKIYFDNSVIEQLQVIPVYKIKGEIFSEKRNFTKQDYLKTKRLEMKCP